MTRFAYSGWFGAWALVVTFTSPLAAQAPAPATIVALPTPLLPQTVHDVARSSDATGGEDPAQADATHAAALKEDGLQRFARATYGKTQVQALQFNDATGARSAFTLYLKDGATGPKLDGVPDDSAVVDGKTLVLKQTVVLIAERGADDAMLTEIARVLPRIGGPRSQPPLLPTFFPAKALVPHSLRYAQGAASYVAMGGALSTSQLGWEKSAEAAFAKYADRRGKETVTLLLYPTPQIAADHLRAIEAELPAGMKVRREGELLVAAQGSFSAADAQSVVESIHVRSQVTFDKPMPPEFHAEVQKTYSLLVSISILSGFGCLAAVMLGLFFGGGRAIVRKLQGKEASTDAEFLSLHLAPQNEKPKFEPPSL